MILALCATLPISALNAQYFEAGATTGAAAYIGELSDHKLSQHGIKPLIGVFGRYNLSPYWSFKAAFTKASISGSDVYSRLAESRERNLNFRSDILEFAVCGELNLSDYNVREDKTAMPYVFAGIGGFYFNPQAEMRGAWYDLQPLRTEGHFYHKFGLNIPLGIGLKFNLSEKMNFGLELGARKLFTDYLDDVSNVYPDVMALRSTNLTAALFSYRTPEVTGEFGNNPYNTPRGNPQNDDWYFFAGLTVSVNLTDKYGLDFDPRFEPFKNKPARNSALSSKKSNKRHKTVKYMRKQQRKEAKMLVKSNGSGSRY
ncbi:MAG: hypothetical protein RI973_1008 [Bacteroidota bacterium]